MITAVYSEAEHLHALELIAAAKEFSEKVIAICESAEQMELCRRAGAEKICMVAYLEDDCEQGNRIAEVVQALAPDSVLFPATIRGRFLSAWVAALLETGLTADCTGLGKTENGLLLQSRPAFGGNLMADILCKTNRPQMASVRPGIFPMPDFVGKTEFHLKKEKAKTAWAYLTRLSFEASEEEGVSLQDACVIVAGGKGVGSSRGFEKLAYLARMLGGAVGATRSAVDAGYIGYDHQIGQTGVTVRARLYIAFGISGAIQHTVGMNACRMVMAVNRDRLAPIFRTADYGIADDWEKVADQMIEALESARK